MNQPTQIDKKTMALATCRKAVTRALKTKFNEATTKKYEEIIYQLCQAIAKQDGKKVDEVYRTQAYQRVGHLITAASKEDKEAVVNNIKEHVMEWDSQPFVAYRAALEVLMNKTVDRPLVQKGAFICKGCKKDECYWWSLQTRGCDESATVFVQCVSCGKRWKES